MIYAFLVTLRDGLETFMILGVAVAYFQATGRGRLAVPIAWAIAAGMVVAAVGGYLVYDSSNHGLLLGPLAILAAAITAWLIVLVRRDRARLDRPLQTPSTAIVFAVALYMCAWKGMQLATFAFQIAPYIRFFIGWVLGVLAAALAAWAFAVGARFVSPRVVSGAAIAFLVVFGFELMVQGVHMASEVSQLPYSQFIHDNTESWGPESSFGRNVRYLLGVVPAIWCLLDRKNQNPALSRSSR